MAAVFGGTQSLHTNSFDEALALPTDVSARVARDTQLILQEETHIPGVVDPWAGSYMMERLTHEMAGSAAALLEEIEAQGGMLPAVESGWAKLKIEASAAEKQARIDSGLDVIIGVNKYVNPQQQQAPPLRHIDNGAVRAHQVAQLERIRTTRDGQAVQAALAALRQCAQGGVGNLLELAVTAMRARATVGEVSDTLEKVWGRHSPVIRSVSGVYAASHEDAAAVESLRAEVAAFATQEGRRPRVLVAKLGQDGHDRGAKVVATAFADLGFDVDIGSLFQTAEECARQAIENDVHAVGISTLAAGHMALVPPLIEALRTQGAGDVAVFVGGIVPQADHEALYKAGVKAIFGPGAPVLQSAKRVLDEIVRNSRGR
jgi:methylmalonyl-CoA mutase